MDRHQGSNPETHSQESFSALCVESIALVSETLLSGGTSFPKPSAGEKSVVSRWEDAFKQKLGEIDAKYSEKARKAGLDEGTGLAIARLYRSVVDHRIQRISAVSGAFTYGTDQVLVADEVVGDERVRQGSWYHQRAGL